MAASIAARGTAGKPETGDTRAYEACAAHLRKMRPILKSLRQPAEWAKLLADIRANYRNRPRCMEVLDKLEG